MVEQVLERSPTPSFFIFTFGASIHFLTLYVMSHLSWLGNLSPSATAIFVLFCFGLVYADVNV